MFSYDPYDAITCIDIYIIWRNSDCKLINEIELAVRDTSYDLGTFERSISKMCQKAREDLTKYWLPKIQRILITVLYDKLYAVSYT